MSPEVTLLVRAALLGLLVFAAERFAKRRQEKRHQEWRAACQSVIRLPAQSVIAPEPSTGRPVQVVVRARANAALAHPEILRLESTQTAVTTAPKLYDGHVTEKRAA